MFVASEVLRSVSEMATEQATDERDRWQAMRGMRAEGKGFAAMIEPLIEAGLLQCQNTHRKRRGRGGIEVCATCEDTISQHWRRHLAQLGAEDADVLEVRGAWLEAHFYIADTCRTRAVQKIRITTTKTHAATTDAEGKQLAPTTETTVREEVRVNVGLLRLYSEIHDKIARMTGIDIDDPEALEKVPRGKVNVRRASNGGSDRAGTGDGGAVH